MLVAPRGRGLLPGADLLRADVPQARSSTPASSCAWRRSEAASWASRRSPLRYQLGLGGLLASLDELAIAPGRSEGRRAGAAPGDARAGACPRAPCACSRTRTSTRLPRARRSCAPGPRRPRRPRRRRPEPQRGRAPRRARIGLPRTRASTSTGPAGRLEAVLMHPDWRRRSRRRSSATRTRCTAGMMHFKAGVPRGEGAAVGRASPCCASTSAGWAAARARTTTASASRTTRGRRSTSWSGASRAGRSCSAASPSAPSVALRVAARDPRVRAVVRARLPAAALAASRLRSTGSSSRASSCRASATSSARPRRSAPSSLPLPPPRELVVVPGADHFFDGPARRLARARSPAGRRAAPGTPRDAPPQRPRPRVERGSSAGASSSRRLDEPPRGRKRTRIQASEAGEGVRQQADPAPEPAAGRRARRRRGSGAA